MGNQHGQFPYHFLPTSYRPVDNLFHDGRTAVQAGQFLKIPFNYMFYIQPFGFQYFHGNSVTIAIGTFLMT